MPKDTSLPIAAPNAEFESGEPQRLAAIDLGSNSFHLLVANYQNERLQVVARLGEKVQLAAGLDENGYLSEAAMQRALDCLGRFAPFLTDIEGPNLRIVGTNALRDAHNSQTFIERAEAQLGHAIEIIAGREEARLIYLGAAHALAESGRRLIVDIGGGSTEFIIGEAFEPKALESLRMGCVTFTGCFFADGELTEKRMRRAELAALSELANIQRPYQRLGWDDPVGSSGTIKAAASVLHAYGDTPQEGVITRSGLKKLRERLLKCKHLEKVELDGLKPDRARVFPAGIAILSAIFEAFDLHQMRFADGALREGVLYDLIGRHHQEDIRDRTLSFLMERYHVDTEQAARVEGKALEAFDQVSSDWGLDEEWLRELLGWAARVHEVGLDIAHYHYHKHGAYLIEHSDLPGFSRQDQQMLALLVRGHRRNIPRQKFEEMSEDGVKLTRLCVLLRFAILFHHIRGPQQAPAFQLKAGDNSLDVAFPDGWLANNPLTQADFALEADWLKRIDFTLSVR